MATNITVYTKTGCPWCNGVISFLDENNIQYEERNVSENKAFYDQMVDISGQTKAPVIDMGGEVLADTDREELEEWLRERGAL